MPIRVAQSRTVIGQCVHGALYNGSSGWSSRRDVDSAREVHRKLLDPEATDTPTAKGLKRVNPRHVLVWEIALEPGERRTLSYTYEVYVRN